MLMQKLEISMDSETAQEISENITASLETLESLSLPQLWRDLQSLFRTYMPRLLSVLLILLLGLAIIKLLDRGIRRFVRFRIIDSTLHSFLLAVLHVVLYAVLAVTCLGMLGIPLTPLITMLGAAGLAFSLALQDSLSNIAGGISILFNRPFSKEEYVEIGPIAGTVKEIGLVYTQLRTLDNKHVYLPNGDVAKSTIINYSREPKRRLDLEFPVRAGCDLAVAAGLIRETLLAHPLVLREPEPIVRATGHTYALVKISCFVWVETPNLLELKGQLIIQVRQKLSENQF